MESSPITPPKLVFEDVVFNTAVPSPQLGTSTGQSSSDLKWKYGDTRRPQYIFVVKNLAHLRAAELRQHITNSFGKDEVKVGSFAASVPSYINEAIDNANVEQTTFDLGVPEVQYTLNFLLHLTSATLVSSLVDSQYHLPGRPDKRRPSFKTKVPVRRPPDDQPGAVQGQPGAPLDQVTVPTPSVQPRQTAGAASLSKGKGKSRSSSARKGQVSMDVELCRLLPVGTKTLTLEHLCAVEVKTSSVLRRVFQDVFDAMGAGADDRAFKYDPRDDGAVVKEDPRISDHDQDTLAKLVAFMTDPEINISNGMFYGGTDFLLATLVYLPRSDRPSLAISPLLPIDASSPAFLTHLVHALLSSSTSSIPATLQAELEQRVAATWADTSSAAGDSAQPSVDAGRESDSSSGGRTTLASGSSGSKGHGKGTTRCGWLGEARRARGGEKVGGELSGEVSRAAGGDGRDVKDPHTIRAELRLSNSSLTQHHHLRLLPLPLVSTPPSSNSGSKSSSDRHHPNTNESPSPTAFLPSALFLLRGPLESAFSTSFYAEDVGLRKYFIKYSEHEFEGSLSLEASVYARLRLLPSAPIPHLFGLFSTTIGKEPGLALVLSYVGAALESFESLSRAERLALYTALTSVHVAGVLHGDFYPRNVCRDEKNDFKLIDFGLSSLHECVGESCAELHSARLALGLDE